MNSPLSPCSIMSLSILVAVLDASPKVAIAAPRQSESEPAAMASPDVADMSDTTNVENATLISLAWRDAFLGVANAWQRPTDGSSARLAGCYIVHRNVLAGTMRKHACPALVADGSSSSSANATPLDQATRFAKRLYAWTWSLAKTTWSS